MVEKVKQIIMKRHFWRTVGFDELSELYATQMLRSLSVSLVGLFVPIYLYKSGYSIAAICGMFLAWTVIRPLWLYVGARLIGWYGPKHAMAIAVIVQIGYLALILTINDLHWPLWLVGIVGSFCYGVYLLAFDVDFSKIKHTEHGGKEISYMQMFERFGAILGPIIGGLIATFIDPRYTIAIAIIVLGASLIPIFLSAEPVRQHQIILVKGFPWRRHSRDFVAISAFNLENIVSITVWPLFLGVFVLLNNTYAALGIIAAISTAVAFLAIFTIGKLIDKQHGKRLLDIGAVTNAFLHLVRPFIALPAQALAVNIVNEPVTAMYRMPFLKGLYDAADSIPGYRITYFYLTNLVASFANMVFWAILFAIASSGSDKVALQIAFVIGFFASLVITQQKFAALRK
jgi:MFS family permease